MAKVNYLKDVQSLSNALEKKGMPNYFKSDGENALLRIYGQDVGTTRKTLGDLGLSDENTLGARTGAVFFIKPEVSQLSSKYPSSTYKKGLSN